MTTKESLPPPDPRENLKSRIHELLTRGVHEVVYLHELESRLLSGVPLRIKWGIDPTSPHIHLGRAISLFKLRDFQELGHQLVLVIGDFTGEIGDTSDKESERPMLDPSQVADNMQDYLAQCGKIIDLSQTEVVYNSHWLKALTLADISHLANLFSVSEFISRINIKNRLAAGKRVSVRELLYPIMQGYDSAVIRADIEIGGSDQKFNLLAGREIQRYLGQPPQNFLTTRLLTGLDGRKMSSTWGNTIDLTDTPIAMFQKLMRLDDKLITEYFTLATRVPLLEIDQISHDLARSATNPRDTKLHLATEIVSTLCGSTAARLARAHFTRVLTAGQFPEEIAEFPSPTSSILDALVATHLAVSKNEARRLINNHGIKLNGQTVYTDRTTIPDGAILQRGKSQFARVKLSQSK